MHCALPITYQRRESQDVAGITVGAVAVNAEADRIGSWITMMVVRGTSGRELMSVSDSCRSVDSADGDARSSEEGLMLIFLNG